MSSVSLPILDQAPAPIGDKTSFGDALDLFDQGYYSAAAVVGRIVVERFLHAAAEACRDVPKLRKRRPRLIKEKLYDAHLIDQPTYYRLKRVYKIGAAAGHGRDPGRAKVQELLDHLDHLIPILHTLVFDRGADA